MLRKYYPYEYAKSVFAIDYKKLYNAGIRAIIFDLDNTLVHHGDNSNDRVDALFRHIHKAGLKTLLLTNNDEPRVKRFIKNIDTLYICDADKPEPKGYLKALEMLGTTKEQTIVIGDQMFIDIIGANGVGIPSVLVHYIPVPGEIWLGFKRYIEMMILVIYKFDRRYRHRLGDILRSPHKKEN